MRVLLVSTYELGHQPLHVASPAAALRAAGHEVRTLDLAAEAWSSDAVDDVDALAVSVPMHTAMRLAVEVAAAARHRRPALPVCLYGLYAAVSHDTTVGSVADAVVAGEYEPGLLAWVEGLAGGEHAEPVTVHLGRSEWRPPARDLVPPLERYAHLEHRGEHRPVGYLEASHGCRHRCRHCPVPAVYDGRIRTVDPAVLVADADRLVAAGARHLTFGDPDFLNAPAHARRVVAAVHDRHPEVTFDVTVKVEHVLRHESVWPELAAAGCLFVTTAVEVLNDRILALLDKGHTAADADRAVEVLTESGIDPHPSFLPFTPWTTVDDVAGILSFVARHDLVPVVDPVQYGLRLLVPEGSLLLEVPELAPHLEAYEPDALTWRWRAADPRIDRLQATLAAIAEDAAARGEAASATFRRVHDAVVAAGGRALWGTPARRWLDGTLAGAVEDRPRLTEPWFC